jgi:hypothetical protein
VRKFLALLIFSLFLTVLPIRPPRALAAETPSGIVTVCTTLPWITSMAQFIAGSTIRIQPLTTWTDAGTLRTLRRPDRSAIVIALDPKDALIGGIPADNPNLHLLYNNFPVRDIGRGALAFDPSVLPFMSQRMLIVISEFEPDNYPFYQRRLAEFQSRLESTLEVGRSLIKDVKLLDLTGSAGPWIRAASDGAVRPPDDRWGAWMSDTRMNELKLAIDEANRRGWWIVHDAWTPPPVRREVIGAHNNIFIKQPERPDYDFFAYLHNIYLEIWNTTAWK